MIELVEADKTVEEQMEWAKFKGDLEHMLKGFGTLLFLPIILIAALCVAFRAALIEGAKEGLKCLEKWA